MRGNPKDRVIVINRIQVLIGAGGLLFGFLVYLISRPPDQTYFLYRIANISLYHPLPNLFVVIGNSLPDFLHVFSFILITAGLFSCKRQTFLIISLGWCFVDIAFELGQKFSTWSSGIIPDWFAGVPVLENTENYFLKGTFDSIDVAAIALGTVIAYFVLLTTNKSNRREIA